MDFQRRDWIVGASVVCGMIILIMMMTFILRTRSSGEIRLDSKGEKIAIIELTGPIYDSRRFVRQFKRFGEHSSVKAIVFRIESPGGGVAASQEVYESVRRAREAGKPVVASFGSVAASGGYYVACGADTIVANPGTTTGSIGVIAQFVNMEELFDKVGIQYDVIKSGRYKDMGTPHRSLLPQEKALLQSWVDDAHEQFVKVVEIERGLELSHVRRLADGRVFTGNQAHQEGLVDILGDYQMAIDVAASMAGIEGEPVLVKERQRRITLFDLLFQRLEGLIRGSGGVTLEYLYR